MSIPWPISATSPPISAPVTVARLAIATKYWRLTQQFFSAQHGIQLYRIVESLGATEGAPASGSADIIVDITSTGSTLKANHLKILSDGIMLRSRGLPGASAQGGACGRSGGGEDYRGSAKGCRLVMRPG